MGDGCCDQTDAFVGCHEGSDGYAFVGCCDGCCGQTYMSLRDAVKKEMSLMGGRITAPCYMN